MKHAVLPRGRELTLPILSGLLLTLSFPPFHLLLPPFIALVPFLLFLASCPPDREGRASAMRGAFWMGVVYYGTLLYWLFAALVFYTWLALLGYLITVVVLAGVLSGVGYAAHRLRSAHTLPFWATLPFLWTAGEWLRGHLGDLAFPWLGLGHALTGFPVLVGFADVVGARGVTFWLVAANALIAEAWLGRRRRIWRPLAGALTAVLAVPVGYSVYRWYTLDTRPAAEVLVVQPNIPEDLKLEREQAIDSSRTALERLTVDGLRDAPGTQLVVWPEAALPDFIQSFPDWEAWVSRMARRDRVAFIFGALDLKRFPGGGYEYYNAALFVTSEGRTAGIYRKHYLVPVVERVPFVPLRWIRALRRSAAHGWNLPLLGNVGTFFEYFGGFGQGDREPVFQVDGARVGVLVCYESIFPGLSRTYRRRGANLLVNITNDAWFGRERPWWSRTSALYQHPAHLVMRAIENRIGVARAANTGISLFVDPRGRIHEATPLFEPATRHMAVQTTDELTVYARFGDVVGWMSALSVVALMLASVWRRRG